MLRERRLGQPRGCSRCPPSCPKPGGPAPGPGSLRPRVSGSRRAAGRARRSRTESGCVAGGCCCLPPPRQEGRRSGQGEPGGEKGGYGVPRDAAASPGRASPGAPGRAPGACSGELGAGGKRVKWEENQQRKLLQGA